MSYYEYMLVFLGVVFCVYASYTDLRLQKIRNFCSLGLLYVGTLSQLMAWYLGTITPVYLFSLFFGSGFVAFGFYWFGIFSPGDSKLFWGLCLIFPHALFRSLSGSLSFPPLILALNIIVPYSVGLLGYLLFKFVLMPEKVRIFRSFLKSNFQKTDLLKNLLNLVLLMGIGSALTALFELFGWHPDRFLRLVLVVAAFGVCQRLLRTPVYQEIAAFGCAWLLIWSSPSVLRLLSDFALFFGVYVGVYVVVKAFVLNLASMTFERSVDVGDLKVGMIPAEEIVRVASPDGGVRHEKRQVAFSSHQSSDIVISPDPLGLKASEIVHLQHLAASGAFSEFKNRIRVQPSIPFAPVISMGALLTILCQGPFYQKLLALL